MESCNLPSLKLKAKAPENQWFGVDEFPVGGGGWPILRVLTIGFP